MEKRVAMLLADEEVVIICHGSVEFGARALGNRAARFQIVSKEQNPSYYSIIREFEIITKRGVLHNASFNLHGYPIVYGPGRGNEDLHQFLAAATRLGRLFGFEEKLGTSLDAFADVEGLLVRFGITQHTENSEQGEGARQRDGALLH